MVIRKRAKFFKLNEKIILRNAALIIEDTEIYSKPSRPISVSSPNIEILSIL